MQKSRLLKKFLMLMVVFSVVCSTFSPVGLWSNMSITAKAEWDDVVELQLGNPIMTVNGEAREIDPGLGTVPTVLDGVTMIPIRALIEAVGGCVFWNQENQVVTVCYGEHVVFLKLDCTTAHVDGEKKNMSTAPTAINGRTMLPVRFVSESLDFWVDWEQSTQTVTITVPGDSIWLDQNMLAAEMDGDESNYMEKIFFLEDVATSSYYYMPRFVSFTADGKAEYRLEISIPMKTPAGEYPNKPKDDINFTLWTHYNEDKKTWEDAYKCYKDPSSYYFTVDEEVKWSTREGNGEFSVLLEGVDPSTKGKEINIDYGLYHFSRDKDKHTVVKAWKDPKFYSKDKLWIAPYEWPVETTVPEPDSNLGDMMMLATVNGVNKRFYQRDTATASDGHEFYYMSFTPEGKPEYLLYMRIPLLVKAGTYPDDGLGRDRSAYFSIEKYNEATDKWSSYYRMVDYSTSTEDIGIYKLTLDQDMYSNLSEGSGTFAAVMEGFSVDTEGERISITNGRFRYTKFKTHPVVEELYGSSHISGWDDPDDDLMTDKTERIVCPKCNGAKKLECFMCDGTGKLERTEYPIFGGKPYTTYVKCQACHNGYYSCTSCGGKGYI